MFKLKNPQDIKAPFDLVQFPSMGLFYPDKRTGVLVKYLSGVEEQILTAPMLYYTGIAFDMALDSLIMEEGVVVDDLLVCDRNSIILFLRYTGYGDGYPINITCPSCGETGETKFSISSMEGRDIKVMPDEEGCYSYKLQNLKINNEPVVVRFSPMRVRDEKIYLHALEQHKSNPRAIPIDITLKYKLQIRSINNIKDDDFIEKVISNMPFIDSQALRNYMEKIEPGIDSKVTITCDKCTHRYIEEYPINTDFFGITPEYKNVILEEMFLLEHYSEGNVGPSDSLIMATNERRWRLQRLADEINKRNSAQERASKAGGKK